MLVFEERGKPEYAEKNLSEKSREPTNSAQIWRRVRESNTGHIGGRRAFSPLRQPCSLWFIAKRSDGEHIIVVVLHIKTSWNLTLGYKPIALSSITCSTGLYVSSLDWKLKKGGVKLLLLSKRAQRTTLKRPSHGKLKLTNSCWQTQVGVCERRKNSRQTRR